MPSSAVHRQWKLPAGAVTLSRNGRGDWIAIALGNGELCVMAAHADTEDMHLMALHNGVSLSLQADADGHSFMSGGDDGKVFLIDPMTTVPTLLVEHNNKWIDHVASSIDGHRAFSIGKDVFLLNEEGQAVATLAHPSSIGGLAFSPNGKRLAATHYNGVSLWWPNAKDGVPVKLTWKGSHLGLVWHPEGKMLMTGLQEGALHGWRFSDNNEMQMQGYAGKIHSMHFTAKGRYLATSGAPQVICWPYFGGGPWGKTPMTLGDDTGALISQVAPHPKDELVAAGYDNGMVILGPLDGRREMVIHAPRNARVVGLVWNGAGNCLFAAFEDGYLMLFTIDSVKNAVSHV